jgi:hypothetical protein
MMSRPLIWLLAIVLLALGLRAWKITEPLQRDEFGALYAVAERKTATADAPPTAADPLVPVGSFSEVSERSVLPFGIRNPAPLYHDIVYVFLQVLPVAEWSLRLPSLLAGLACVVGVYFLCRRMIGVEMGLVAALFVAVEPIQVTTSVIARPYALGNLACVLSFAALIGALNARKPLTGVLRALGYGASVAFMGYMNPVLLLVVIAHVALVIYWAIAHQGEGAKAVYWVLGVAVSALLMLPEYGYFGKLQEFSASHRDYLQRLYPTELIGFFKHNASFLAGLVVAWVAAYIVRQQMQASDEMEAEEGEPSERVKPASDSPTPAPTNAITTAPAAAVAEAPAAEAALAEPPPPDNPDVIWVGRLWIFLPQLVALVLAYAAGEAIFYSRFLSYTTLGGLVILAYWATRERTREIRLGVSAAIALSLFLMGLMTLGRGHGLTTGSEGKQIAKDLDGLESCKAGDVVLLRSGPIEGDLLPDQVAPENRGHVAGALAAPLTTLYAPTKSLHVVILSKSHNSPWAKASARELYNPEHFYSKEFGERLRSYNQQFWIANDTNVQLTEFLTCFLPWLADQLGYDLKVARQRSHESGERYFTVQADSREGDFLDGLMNSRPTDFALASLIRVQRLCPQPRLVTNVGSFAATPTSASPAIAVSAVWLATQDRAPRLASGPQEATTADKSKP